MGKWRIKVVKRGLKMRKVIVKKRKIEREFGNLKLVFLVYDV